MKFRLRSSTPPNSVSSADLLSSAHGNVSLIGRSQTLSSSRSKFASQLCDLLSLSGDGSTGKPPNPSSLSESSRTPGQFGLAKSAVGVGVAVVAGVGVADEVGPRARSGSSSRPSRLRERRLGGAMGAKLRCSGRTTPRPRHGATLPARTRAPWRPRPGRRPAELRRVRAAGRGGRPWGPKGPRGCEPHWRDGLEAWSSLGCLAAEERPSSHSLSLSDPEPLADSLECMRW